MTLIATRKRSDAPPRGGPLAKRKFVDGRWIVSLRPRGRRLVDRYLRLYPEPARVLLKIRPRWSRSLGLFNPDSDQYQETNAIAAAVIVDAATLHDPSIGAKFTTYAVWHIIGACQKHLLRQSRIPQFSQLNTEYGDPICLRRFFTSNSFAYEPEKRYPDTLPAIIRSIRKVAGKWNEKLFAQWYIHGRSFSEIGRRYRLSAERIRQICTQILVKHQQLLLDLLGESL